MIKALILVGLGGAAGSILRWLVQKSLQSQVNAFPWGTLSVNIAGCLLIGIVWGLSSRMSNAQDMQFLLATGFCGGFTTFSAFSQESIRLMEMQKTGLMFAYIAVSVIAGLAATLIAYRLTR